MPSIAIVGTRGYPSFYGGFETAVRNLAPFLADAGWDVTVYGRKGGVALNAVPDDRIRPVNTWGINSKSLSTLTYGLTSSLHCAIKKPDVVLVMNVANGYWLPLLKARGIPTIVNVDGIEWIREKWGRIARAVFFGGARMTARLADELVFDAQAIGDYWREEFGRSGSWIPYGASELDLSGGDDEFPSGAYVLAVARLVPENTIPEFLDAAEDLTRHTRVVLVGSSGFGGPLEERARQLAVVNENFTWLGHINDDLRLFRLWANAGAYFHGHSVGGTNPALVQAMMLGAPTVARDTVFNREVLGDTGLFVIPEERAIAEQLLSLLNDPDQKKRMADASKRRAKELYTWPLVNQRYLDLFLAHLGGSRTRGSRG
jgi:glycosyltransferase involved in cell wall biosynthesis